MRAPLQAIPGRGPHREIRVRSCRVLAAGLALSLGLPIHAAIAARGPLDPDSSRASFHLEPGLIAELFAAEPLVRSPAALAWDESAQLHVVENPDYPVGPDPAQPFSGALVRLTDIDQDGRAETRTVVADALRFPNGLMPWRGGWLVTDAPHLWWLSDTNQDGRADLREVWFTGFATNSTTQLRANSPTLGPDGWIYVARGLVGGVITSPHWPHLPPVDLKDGDFRFRPDGRAAEAVGGNAQFGLVLDDVGRRFFVANRNPLVHAVLDPRWWLRHPWLPFTDVAQDVSPTGYDARVFPRSADTTTAGFMPELMAAPHAGTFTSACGIHQHFGGGLGPEREGSWLICEPAQNLVQRQQASARGATFTSRSTTRNQEFLASTDPWFHPVWAATGPDGAVYLADFYRGVLDHPEYLPADVRPRMDFAAGKNHGRIWRIRTSAPASPPAVTPVGLNADEWARALSHSNLWTRQTAHRLLYQQGDASVVRRLLSEPLPAIEGGTAAAAGFARRLRLLVGMLPLRAVRDHLGPADHTALLDVLRQGLAAAAPEIREATLRAVADPGISRVAAPPLNAIPIAWLTPLLLDTNAAVRFQAMQACLAFWVPAEDSGVRAAYTLAALRNGDDRWTRNLALVALRGNELDVFDHLLRIPLAPHPAGYSGVPELAADLARVVALQPQGKVPAALNLVLDPALPAQTTDTVHGLLLGLAEGLRASGTNSLFDTVTQASAEGLLPESALPRFLAITEQQQSVAFDQTATVEDRMRAVRFLAELPASRARDPLLKLAESEEPVALRRAAIRALARFASPGTATALTSEERWRTLTPALQQEVLSAFGAQPTLLPELLDALEAGRLPLWAFPTSQRRALANHRDAAVRARAQRIFDPPGGTSRQRVYETLKPLASRAGQSRPGRDVFQRLCASCHRHGNLGVDVGPDLTSVRNQPAEAILLHLVVPDAEIYPGYQAYDVETRDGRSMTGLVVSENQHALTLRRTGGGEETLLRSQIASLTLSQVSLMPQELEKTMSETELIDLLAFLRAAP